MGKLIVGGIAAFVVWKFWLAPALERRTRTGAGTGAAPNASSLRDTVDQRVASSSYVGRVEWYEGEAKVRGFVDLSGDATRIR